MAREDRTANLTRFVALGIGVIAAIIYLQTVGFEFVDYDDPWLIRDNLILRQPNWQSLLTACFDLSWQQRRALGSEFLPIRDLSIMLDALVWGDWIGGYHLSNILYYGVTCALLTRLFEQVFKVRRVAWTAALLFALHPVHVEAVAWLSERKGLVAAMFICASLLAFLRYARRGNVVALLSSAFFLCVAIWSKAMAVATIGMFVLLLPFIDDKEQSPIPRRVWFALPVLTLAGFAAFYPGWRTGKIMGMVSEYHGGSLAATAKLMGAVHSQYLLQSLGGGEFAMHYPVDVENVSAFSSVIGGLLFASMCLFVVVVAIRFLMGKYQNFSPGKTKALCFAFVFGWWIVWLAPVSQLIFPLQNFRADRYLFMPVAASAIFVALMLEQIPRRQLKLLVLVVFSFFFLVRTSFQTMVWADTESLFAHAVEVDPSFSDGWNRLASTAEKKKDFQGAMFYVDKGLSVNPDDADLLHRRAMVFHRGGEAEEAKKAMLRAAMHPQGWRAKANYSLLLMRAGELKNAFEWAKRSVLENGAAQPHAQRTLGRVAANNGELKLACNAFYTVTRLEANRAQNYLDLAQCYKMTGDLAGAKAAQQRADSLRHR